MYIFNLLNNYNAIIGNIMNISKNQIVIYFLFLSINLIYGQTHITDEIKITPQNKTTGIPYYEIERPGFKPFEYDESMGKELIQERTLYRKVFLKPDGTKKVRIYANPIHTRDSKNNLINLNMNASYDSLTVNSSNEWQIGHKPTEGPISHDPDHTIVELVSHMLNYGNCFHLITWVFVKFPVNEIPINSQILNAVFNIYSGRYINCNNYPTDYTGCGEWCDDIPTEERKLIANVVYAQWDEDLLSSSRPWILEGFPGSDYKATPEDTLIISEIHQIGPPVKRSINLTDAVNNWYNGSVENNGFLIKDTDYSNPGYVMSFVSRNNSNINYRPYVDITYIDSVEPKLRIIDPDTSSSGECILPYIDENLPIEEIYPVMPEVNCKAVFEGLSSLTTDTINVNWEYIVEYDYWWRDSQVSTSEFIVTASDTLNGISQIFNTDTTSWSANFEDKFLGGNVTIIASSEVNGTVYSDTLKNIYEIMGTNPIPQKARDKVALLDSTYKYALWTIMYYETQNYTNQFVGFNPIDKVGYPLYGKPAGYGLFQIDPISSTNQLWNWVANIKEGSVRLNEKVKERNDYVNKVRKGTDIYTKWDLQYDPIDTTLTKKFHDRLNYNLQNGFPGATALSTNPANDQANIVLHQLYQGHYYYIWIPNDPWQYNGPGIWEVNPFLIVKKWNTGERRNSLEKDIINGNYPHNWNNHLIGCQ